MSKENSKGLPKKFDIFLEEFEGSQVRVVLHNEKVINGIIAESRKYWVKVMVDPNTYYYINKAWIVYIQPLKVKK